MASFADEDRLREMCLYYSEVDELITPPASYVNRLAAAPPGAAPSPDGGVRNYEPKQLKRRYCTICDSITHNTKDCAGTCRICRRCGMDQYDKPCPLHRPYKVFCKYCLVNGHHTEGCPYLCLLCLDRGKLVPRRRCRTHYGDNYHEKFCKYCDDPHDIKNCPLLIQKPCTLCGKRGHIPAVCYEKCSCERGFLHSKKNCQRHFVKWIYSGRNICDVEGCNSVAAFVLENHSHTKTEQVTDLKNLFGNTVLYKSSLCYFICKKHMPFNDSVEL